MEDCKWQTNGLEEGKFGKRQEIAILQIKWTDNLVGGIIGFERAAIVGGNFHGKFAVVIVHENVKSEASLMQVRNALHPARPGFRRRQRHARGPLGRGECPVRDDRR